MNKKRILSSIFALCMVFSMLLTAQVNVSAKSAKGLKITFDGKSVTLNTKSEPKTLEEVEKIWGKKTRLAGDGEEWNGYAYVWEKGKSKITIMQALGITDGAGGAEGLGEVDGLYKVDGLGYASIEINDKNISAAGVKVGMKGTTALKKLQKAYGKKNVKQIKNGKTYTEIYVNSGNGMPVSYNIKNGKVSNIYWMRS